VTLRRRRASGSVTERQDDSLRPIGARALKSARDTLRPDLDDAIVLDLFAGQGRFGTAALDEGARSAVFVEKNRATAADLSQSLKCYGDRARLFTTDAFDFLSTPPADATGLFSIVFADPPFSLWNAAFGDRLLGAVEKWLPRGGIFLVKHPSRMVAFETIQIAAHGMKVWKSVTFGESQLAYFIYGTDEG
jgi:16S rRNA (guanine966-N2)-methyltransferase